MLNRGRFWDGRGKREVLPLCLKLVLLSFCLFFFGWASTSLPLWFKCSTRPFYSPSFSQLPEEDSDLRRGVKSQLFSLNLLCVSFMKEQKTSLCTYPFLCTLVSYLMVLEYRVIFQGFVALCNSTFSSQFPRRWASPACKDWRCGKNAITPLLYFMHSHFSPFVFSFVFSFVFVLF